MTAVKTISPDREKYRLKPWQIALIVIGSVLATFMIIGLMLFVMWRLRCTRSQSDYENGELVYDDDEMTDHFDTFVG